MSNFDQVFEFIRDYWRRKGISPSYREIGRACGLSSTSSVRYWLDALERQGYIKRYRGISRGIVLQEEKNELMAAVD